MASDPSDAFRPIQLDDAGMLKTDDLRALTGQTITTADARDGCLRLHLAGGLVLAIEATADKLVLSDETAIP